MYFGPFSVKRGSIVRVEMTAQGATPGDPDLYLRYLGKPQLNRWECRPYLIGADETCELEVPTNRDKVYVMVYGYEAGNFDLKATYVVP